MIRLLLPLLVLVFLPTITNKIVPYGYCTSTVVEGDSDSWTEVCTMVDELGVATTCTDVYVDLVLVSHQCVEE